MLHIFCDHSERTKDLHIYVSNVDKAAKVPDKVLIKQLGEISSTVVTCNATLKVAMKISELSH